MRGCDLSRYCLLSALATVPLYRFLPLLKLRSGPTHFIRSEEGCKNGAPLQIQVHHQQIHAARNWILPGQVTPKFGYPLGDSYCPRYTMIANRNSFWRQFLEGAGGYSIELGFWWHINFSKEVKQCTLLFKSNNKDGTLISSTFSNLSRSSLTTAPPSM